MTQRWLDILAQSHDANVGQTLLRLARLATSVHQFEAARQRGTEETEPSAQGQRSVRTEVDR